MQGDGVLLIPYPAHGQNVAVNISVIDLFGLVLSDLQRS